MTINGDSLLYFVPPDFARSFDALKLALAVDSTTIADDICLHGIAALAQVRYSGEYVTDVLLTAEKNTGTGNKCQRAGTGKRKRNRRAFGSE